MSNFPFLKKAFIKRLLLITLIAFSLFLLKTNLFVFNVTSDSMMPNFEINKKTIALTSYYRFKQVNRGDVVVLENPQNNTLYLKRIIGLPGERITILGRAVYINGKKLETLDTQNIETFGNSSIKVNAQIHNKNYSILFSKNDNLDWRFSGTWVIPLNSYFVIGDNRSISKDSRIWGSIDKKHFIGKVII